MLERLIDFLRASLSASRAEHTTVGAELELAAAYLDLLAVRMGARLRWRIEADEFRNLALAPMLVQPLVENAIMHGLEPKIEGGELVVRARMLDGMLCVEVADDGIGLQARRRAPAAASAWPTCASACAACAGRFEIDRKCRAWRDLAPAAAIGDLVTTALIADDEPHLLAYIEEQLAQAWPDLRIIGRAANGIEALRLVDELAPDVVFLDIQMPGLNGMQLAERLCAGGKAPRIVFTTAHEQYALQAFEQSAFDYLLKPIRLERLQRTVARLQEALAAPAAPPADPAAAGMLSALLRQLGMDARACRAAAPPPPAAMDPRGPGPGNAPDRRRRSHLLPEQRQVHQRVRGRRRTPDPHSAAPAARTARSAAVLADPPRRHRRRAPRGRHPHRLPRAPAGALKGREEQLVVSRNYEELFRQM
jgi:CheY-like chemotaxis protein